jgi:antirestriction protein ArdC
MTTKTISKREQQAQEITEAVTRYIEESGTLPWRSGWKTSGLRPFNLKSRKPYRGVNVLLTQIAAMSEGFTSSAWLTYKQAAEMGGQVRKGSKGTRIVFWQIKEKNAPEGEKPETYAFMRHYTVFNLDQIDGIDYAPEVGEPVAVPDAVESIVRGYVKRPAIEHVAQDRAYYTPDRDTITLPDLGQFESPEAYAETLFHELTHSTGHADRLNRELAGKNCRESYAKEELVAELGAAFLMADAGIDANLPAMADYVRGWLKALKDDHTLIIQASQAAQKAVDHISPVIELAETVAA